jgi:DNA-binding IclR family transcriptional regulator
MNSKPGVAAVDRAFDILDAFRQTKPVLTLAEISRSTGLYKSTILRLLGSLEKYGFIWQRPDGTYQLGASLLSFATVFQDAFDLRQFVEPTLEKLVNETQEGATFFIRDGNYQVCLFRVDGRHVVRDYSIRKGDRRELNAGAASTILYRFDTPPTTPLDRETMAFVSTGNVNLDMAAVGVPVFGAGEKLLGAMTLSGPRLRFTEDYLVKLTPTLIDAAIRLSIDLGANPAILPRLEGSHPA